MNREVRTNPDGSHDLLEEDDTGATTRQLHVALNEDLQTALDAFWPPSVEGAKADKIAALADYVAAVTANEVALSDEINACTTIAQVNSVDVTAGWPSTPA